MYHDHQIKVQISIFTYFYATFIIHFDHLYSKVSLVRCLIRKGPSLPLSLLSCKFSTFERKLFNNKNVTQISQVNQSVNFKKKRVRRLHPKQSMGLVIPKMKLMKINQNVGIYIYTSHYGCFFGKVVKFPKPSNKI